MTSHKFLIQFTQQTVLQHTDHDGHDIERQNFRIRSYAEFNEAVNKNEDLYGKPFTVVHINMILSTSSYDTTILYRCPWKIGSHQR